MKWSRFLHLGLFLPHLVASQKSTTTYTSITRVASTITTYVLASTTTSTSTTKITSTVMAHATTSISIISSDFCQQASPAIISLKNLITMLHGSLQSNFNLSGPVAATSVSGVSTAPTSTLSRHTAVTQTDVLTANTVNIFANTCHLMMDMIAALQALVKILEGSIKFSPKLTDLLSDNLLGIPVSSLGSFTSFITTKFPASALQSLTARQDIVPSNFPQPPAFLPPHKTCSDNHSFICQVIGGDMTATVSTVDILEGTSLPSTLFPYSQPLTCTTHSLLTSKNISPTLTSYTLEVSLSTSKTTSLIASKTLITYSPQLPSFTSQSVSPLTPPISTAISQHTTSTTLSVRPSPSLQTSFAARSIAKPLLLHILIDVAMAIYTTSTKWFTEFSSSSTLQASIDSSIIGAVPTISVPIPTFLSTQKNSPAILPSTLPISTDPIESNGLSTEIVLPTISSSSLGLTIIPIAPIISTDPIQSGVFSTEIRPLSSSTGHGPVASVGILTTTMHPSSSHDAPEQPSSSVNSTQNSQALRNVPNPVWLLVICGFAAVMIHIGVLKGE